MNTPNQPTRLPPSADQHVAATVALYYAANGRHVTAEFTTELRVSVRETETAQTVVFVVRTIANGAAVRIYVDDRPDPLCRENLVYHADVYADEIDVTNGTLYAVVANAVETGVAID